MVFAPRFLKPFASRRVPHRVTHAELEALGDLRLKDALVLVAFPTTGMAAPIAAQYLIRRLGLPLVGHFRIPEATGVVAIHDGIATGPVRVFGGEIECNLDGGCPHLYLVSSDLPLPPEGLRSVAAGVVGAARDGGARFVVCLEGVVREEGDETADVYCVGAEPKALGLLREATRVEPAARALLVGITAEILQRAPSVGLAAGALIVEARREHPDSRAAAALVEVLDRLLPDLRIDPGPLVEEAMEMERELADQRRQADLQMVRSPQTTFI